MTTQSKSAMSGKQAADSVQPDAARILDDVLTALRGRSSVDFAQYRRGTLQRRLANRMVALRIKSGDDYLSLVRRSDEEVGALAASFTIKVTSFFRNPDTFDFLRREALPALRETFGGGPLRAWSAGCATGEEAYSLAALLREGDQVLATDVDPRAVETARRGVYPAPEGDGGFASLEGSVHEGRFTVAETLRRRLQFDVHDVTSGAVPAGAPFHLVSCRNVLIYFAPPLQQRAMSLLARSMLAGGLLCLGEAEWPVRSVTECFDVLNRKFKLFRRTGSAEDDGS